MDVKSDGRWVGSTAAGANNEPDVGSQRPTPVRGDGRRDPRGVRVAAHPVAAAPVAAAPAPLAG